MIQNAKIFDTLKALAIIITFSISSLNAGTINDQFFSSIDELLFSQVKNGLVDYKSLKNDERLSSLISKIEVADLDGLDDKQLQAFYINAYNLHVINKVVQTYPISSVMDAGGFFDRDKISIANESLTLNKLEKEKLLQTYNDPRYHFVLVCGAKGCPPITNFAYTPDRLEEQLEKQTNLALNDPAFIKFNGGSEVELSEIFKWYAADFGGSKQNILDYINKYRADKIPADTKLKYYTYNWSLNDASMGIGFSPSINTATNSSRYIVSSTIPKGSFEFKIFNNLYSQKTGSDEGFSNRSSFFTTSLSAFYGLTNRFNIGLNTRFRKVRNNALPSSPFSVFGSGGEGSSRSGITAIGPQIRYAPNPKWENFSIQSSFVFAVGEDLTGNAELPFIDWNGATWNTQFFNDFSIGNKFSLFTEIDFLIEDIGSAENNRANRFSTPVTLIFSFVPSNKLTLYTLAGYAPFWQSEFDYFNQFGFGTKYQFTPNLELELLYTDFSNKFLSNNSGQAQTFNLGLRINL